MKKVIVVFLFAPLSTFSFSQNDSAHIVHKSFFAGYVRAGMQQMNFYDLRQYGYLLNQPPDFSIKEEVGFLAGRRDKLLFSAYMGISDIFVFSLNKQKKGNYDNYTVRSGGDYGYWGASLYYNVQGKANLKGFRGIYPVAGIQFVKSTIYSKASGKGIVNADTTFYLEYGNVKSTLINVGGMLELPKLLRGPKFKFDCIPATISFGYTFQFHDPQWTYSTPPSNTSDPRKVNQGGFYFMIGYNIWFSKGGFSPAK
ncbi:MAG: hypothetical protein HY064_05165 [Bacteroidetes bacterium]|nr:hypothetical protein [Bacteroidota bacterium]